jgi:hypothetical protein
MDGRTSYVSGYKPRIAADEDVANLVALISWVGEVVGCDPT